jgi:hypothetical protein
MYGEPSNRDRAEWAKTACEAFGALTGQTGYFDPTNTPEEHVTCVDEIVGDLITDLCHLLRLNNIDPRERIEQSLDRFDEEIDTECPDCGESNEGGDGDGETGRCGNCADRAYNDDDDDEAYRAQISAHNERPEVEAAFENWQKRDAK